MSTSLEDMKLLSDDAVNAREMREKAYSDILSIIQVPEIMSKVDLIVNKTYLPQLDTCRIVDEEEIAVSYDISEHACFFQITELVFDKEEDTAQKLASVYSTAASLNASLAMIVRGYADGHVKLYLGCCNEKSRLNSAYSKANAIYHSFTSNFPGSIHDDKNYILDGNSTRIMVNDCFDGELRAIASVSCIGSRRVRQKNEKENPLFQGMEKVIETMNGREYSMIVLAQPISLANLEAVQRELEGLYTQLSVFSKLSYSVMSSEARTLSEAASVTISRNIAESRSSSLSVGESVTHSKSDGSFASVGAGAVFGGVAAGKNYSTSEGDSKSVNATESKSESRGQSEGSGETKGEALSSNRGNTIQLNLENKQIKEILDDISRQLQRLKNGAGIGLFATAAYFLTSSVSESNAMASTYKALISGDNTSIERSGINVWSGVEYNQVCNYLKRFHHPVFELSPQTGEAISKTATTATLVTSEELAMHMGLPQKSLNGILIRDSVSFGRNIMSLNKERCSRNVLPLGHIYHLGHKQDQEAELDIGSLTMHTFITGTTGAGKSNTIFRMLEGISAVQPETHFMVIEPAKGEYKAVFGSRPDVQVYGTNPRVTHLLRLNPFRFQTNVHVLEHIDRLMSVFTVCWPLEAAMPAILKQAIERAYMVAGWDLRTSVNKISSHLYPTFEDVMNEVNEIMDESDYSGDNKGDYKGALCTRLRELTTGLNHMIFSNNDLMDWELFDENVIIDLSRLGSSESKSLIMGLLVIRMQEYRQSIGRPNTKTLNHVTVLEEAHHLLKRVDGRQDSSNLVARSVEMLGNSLAEMRGYGEGFIIADQAPGLMDLSVIRNTNTKIIMRLPMLEDRKLVGKAATLNDMQVDELAKLPTGVATVYQNDWIEAVLVQMACYSDGEEIYEEQSEFEAFLNEDYDEMMLLDAIKYKDGIEHMVEEWGNDAVDCIAEKNWSTKVKKQVIEYIEHDEEDQLDRLGRVAYELFNMQEVVYKATTESLEAWKEDVFKMLVPSIENFEENDKNLILLLIAHEYANRNKQFEPIYVDLCGQIVR